MTIKPKITHGQITQGLRELAKQQKLSPNEVYSKFMRELFLAELMTRDDGWVVKGGTNLQYLIEGARYTQDLDLYRQENPRDHLEAANQLQRLMDGAQLSHYTFLVKVPNKPKRSGTIDNINVKVLVFFGDQQFCSFSVDISGDIEAPLVNTETPVERSDHLNIPNIPQTYSVKSYPVENQLADKICAMYETQGSSVSTRYRDLYDSGLIVLNLGLGAEDLYQALQTQMAIRNVSLTQPLTWPSSDWPRLDERFVKTLHNTRAALGQADATLSLVGDAINPLIADGAGYTGMVWHPGQQQWVAR